jgi:hypothetical protein
MQTQTNYYSHKLINTTMTGNPFVITCMDCSSWTQTFDVTASTNDRQLPAVALKSIGFDMLIDTSTSKLPNSFTVFYVGLTKGGHAFFGGSVETGTMVPNQTHSHTGSDLNVMLNKDLFNIKKVMRFSLGAQTFATDLANRPHVTNLDDSKKRIYYTEKFNTTIKDTVSGWTACSDPHQPWALRRYWIIFKNNVEANVTDAEMKISYQQMATVCY